MVENVESWKVYLLDPSSVMRLISKLLLRGLVEFTEASTSPNSDRSASTIAAALRPYTRQDLLKNRDAKSESS